MTSDQFTKFLYFASDRFMDRKVYLDHLNLTFSGLAAVGVAVYVTGKTEGIGPVIIMLAAMNMFITLTHYATSYYWWRKENK